MDKFDEKDIATLLRLKRHEQPPPGYFEDFLHEFHRRQRAELLRQPLWRIAVQRAHDFMFQLNVPGLTSYPVAAAAVLVCAGVLSLNVSTTRDAGNGTTVAMHQSAAPVGATPVSVNDEDAEWSLSTPVATRSLGARSFRIQNEAAQTHGSTATPRYVLDSTPVSYEASLRF
jgi:hypothetical protein